jgi:hypothetical protein
MVRHGMSRSADALMTLADGFYEFFMQNIFPLRVDKINSITITHPDEPINCFPHISTRHMACALLTNAIASAMVRRDFATGT